MVCGRVKMPSENDMALFAVKKVLPISTVRCGLCTPIFEITTFSISDNTVCWFLNAGKLGTIDSGFIFYW